MPEPDLRLNAFLSGGADTSSFTGPGAHLLSAKLTNLLRLLIVFVLAAAAIFYACKSIHWQLQIDAPIMHYVNFLIDHGRRPYTDITDNNMPGAYYTEALAMHIFGAGDVAWRIYDFVLLITLTAGLILIARPYDWLAGFFAGAFFIAIHAAEGAKYLVEREQVLTIFFVLGYAAMFASVRRKQPALMLLMGIASGLACSIKPTFLPLPLALLVLLAVVLYRRKIPMLPYIAWAFAGLLVTAALDLGYLLYYHALHGFLFILFTVTPTYAGLARMPFWQLLADSLPQYVPALLLLSIVAALANWRHRSHWNWEKLALAIGAAFGLLSFMAQGKPFLHHRYTFLIFLFLIMGFELLQALRQRGWPQAVSAAALLFALLWIVPQEMRVVIHTGRQMPSGQEPLVLSMELDLQRLGGKATLQDKVQCFDLVYGCLNSLYHLRIVENTSYTGDLLLFTNNDGPAVEYYRKKYWDLDRKDPASVIVLSNEWFQKDNSFDKIKLWPAFATFLQANYTEVIQRRFAGEGLDPHNPDGYRIYIRKNSPLLQKASALQSPAAL